MRKANFEEDCGIYTEEILHRTMPKRGYKAQCQCSLQPHDNPVDMIGCHWSVSSPSQCYLLCCRVHHPKLPSTSPAPWFSACYTLDDTTAQATHSQYTPNGLRGVAQGRASFDLWKQVSRFDLQHYKEKKVSTEAEHSETLSSQLSEEVEFNIIFDT